MFIKVGKGFLNVDFIALIETENSGDTYAIVAWLNRRMFDSEENHTFLYSGTKQQCQAYMTELEKELAAFGKLIRVEVD